MMDILLIVLNDDIVKYIVFPTSIFLIGYGVGYMVGKMKYIPRKPTPNYLGGSSK